ncbi:hypothetical protein BDZ89DRAFT_1064448 [Hymenopellis radicata]|nr:hypothetical protein BDZ89DRAFT_1064448 [Hymenopellis radicata]
MREASSLKMRYSVRDRREMHRISRLQTDETVFLGTKKMSRRYQKMWERWLESKGCDIAIVFEEQPMSS